MNKQGINSENVKITNRASVLQLLFSEGPKSRSDIAAELNLTPATVTMICNEFISQNLLVQNSEDSTPAKVGRKKYPVELNYNCKYILAINIQSYETGIFVCNLKGECFAHTILQSNPKLPPEGFLAGVAERSTKLLWDSQLSIDSILGVGVTILGPVNGLEGVSLNAFGLWTQRVEVKRILEKELNLPVKVESNVCAFLESELMYSNVDAQNILAIKWGPGVGSASAINHRLFKGHNFKSTEVGHNFVDRGGKRCRCGRNGCLETKISEEAIIEKIMELVQAQTSGALRDAVGLYGIPDHKNIQNYFMVEDEAFQNYLNEISYQLAVVVNNAMQIIVPDKVVAFGNIFDNERMFDKFRRQIYAINETIEDDMIVRSQFLKKEDYIGAVAVAVKTFLVEIGGNLSEAMEKRK